MQTINDFDRAAFAEIGANSLIGYTDAERARLAEIAAELRRITKTAQERLRKTS